MRKRENAYSLVEVLISMGVASLAFTGVICGYVQTTSQAEWSCYSLAAHSVAMQGIEQCRAAKWDPLGAVDELGPTNLTRRAILDIPVVPGNTVWATNYLSITNVSMSPPLRQLRADCVWVMACRKGRIRGPFTNTVITLRAPDQ